MAGYLARYFGGIRRADGSQQPVSLTSASRVSAEYGRSAAFLSVLVRQFLRSLLVFAMVTLTTVAQAQQNDPVIEGYRRLNIDDMVHRLIVLAPVPSDAVFRLDERVLGAFGGPAEGYVYLFGNLHGRLFDNEDFQISVHGTFQQEGVSTGGQLDTFQLQAVGMASVLTHYGSAYLGPKYDQSTGEGAVFGDINLDVAYLNFRFTRPVSDDISGQLIQGGPRLDAWVVDWLSSTARAALGALSLNYQRIGSDFDAGVFNSKSIFDMLELELAHDFRSGEFRNFLARINLIPSLPPKDDEPSSMFRQRGFIKDFYGPVLSYFQPPGDDYPARFGGGIELSHTFSSDVILTKGMLFIRRNFVDDIRQQGFLTDSWVAGANMMFGIRGPRRFRERKKDESSLPHPPKVAGSRLRP